ncbi:MAG: hypothetical protein DMF55_06145 [Acidobacteria bacterium]|nr:MAG: hypothetical protein DMF55_06145 [Acidobacteriota bacterium]
MSFGARRIARRRALPNARARRLSHRSDREVAATILGPWDSRPEDGIYSYESEFARHLLGKKTGEGARTPDGQAAEIAGIDPWR